MLCAKLRNNRFFLHNEKTSYTDSKVCIYKYSCTSTLLFLRLNVYCMNCLR
jgi:hypothetical protein